MKRVWFAFVPAIAIALTGLLTNQFCQPLKSTAKNVFLRPPDYVFGIVWPLLYITTGVAWMYGTYDKLFILLTTLLCLWLILYSCVQSKPLAAADLIVSVLLSIYMCVVLFRANKKISSYLLLPLILWLSFASYLNIASINN